MNRQISENYTRLEMKNDTFIRDRITCKMGVKQLVLLMYIVYGYDNNKLKVTTCSKLVLPHHTERDNSQSLFGFGFL